jgi:hypothetical protein
VQIAHADRERFVNFQAQFLALLLTLTTAAQANQRFAALVLDDKLLIIL